MKAAVLYGTHQPLVVEELSLLPPKAGEVRVRFAASGVCHSDLHYIKGDRSCPMPVVLGHEGAGVVEEIGPGVSYVQPGDHVILSLVPACGRCEDCVAGRPNLCEVRYTLNGNLPEHSALSPKIPALYASRTAAGKLRKAYNTERTRPPSTRMVVPVI